MAGRDYYQRGGGGGGGILPNLVTPDGLDLQVARKRQYLAELQHQAEEERARKAADRPGARGVGGIVGGPQYPSPPRYRPLAQPAPGSFAGAMPAYAERGQDFAARLRASFDAVLQQAQQQVAGAPDYPDGPLSGGRDHGAEVINAMRRWEDIFTAQVSASMQAVTELNKHVTLLEDQLATQARDKQLLRERVEQQELAQRELQTAKLESETSLRQLMRDEHSKAHHLRQEITDLRQALDELSRQQGALKVKEERALDDLRLEQVFITRFTARG